MTHEGTSSVTTGGIDMSVDNHPSCTIVCLHIWHSHSHILCKLSSSFRHRIGRSVVLLRTRAAWIVQKVPRTGKEDTAQGIRIAYIAYYPILYPGPLGVHPLTRVPLGSLRVKRVFGTLASPGYLQVTSPRISYLNFFFLTST